MEQGFINLSRTNEALDRQGVYFFVKSDYNDNRKVLYVGRTVNVKARLKQHKPFISMLSNGMISTEYLIVEVLYTDEIVSKEQEFIKKYNPPYNGHSKRKKVSPIVTEIQKALDGRKYRQISMDVRIPEQDFSRKMSGKAEFTTDEIERIEQRLKVKLQT